MLSVARLRLTAWYLLILTVIVGLLSIGLYRLVHQVQQADLHTQQLHRSHFLADLFAHETATLAYQIIGVDVAVLFVAAFGAYLLAGRTLRPIELMVERQRRFAAAASHELRTPLTALRGNVEVTLLQPRSSKEYEAALQKTLATTERMSELVQDLTLLARPTADAALILQEILDLTQLARAAHDGVKALMARKCQTLRMELNGPLPILGDRLKLEQVIVNLLDNAITYTPNGGTITMLGQRDRLRAVLSIHDTGPGIAPDQLPHLFEPFYQVGASGSAVGHVGLGLALADWTVRAHRGKLEVQSDLGVGTVFTLTLPLADSSRGIVSS
jgi:signal transduction histidine kinase